jgi:hypothetical protein
MKLSLNAFAFLTLAGSNLLRQGADAADTRTANKLFAAAEEEQKREE